MIWSAKNLQLYRHRCPCKFWWRFVYGIRCNGWSKFSTDLRRRILSHLFLHFEGGKFIEILWANCSVHIFNKLIRNCSWKTANSMNDAIYRFFEHRVGEASAIALGRRNWCGSFGCCRTCHGNRLRVSRPQLVARIPETLRQKAM